MTRRLAQALRALPAPAQDGLLAALLCATDLFVYSNLGLQSAIAPTYSDQVLVGYAALGYLALLWRRRAPVLVFALLWVHALIAAYPTQYQPVLGLVAAVYTLAERRPGARVWLVLPLAVLPSAVDGWVQLSGLTGTDRLVAFLAVVLYYVLVNGGAWGVGRWAWANHERTLHLEYRREVEARAAVAREQARIARELHDIVAHAVTVMVLQAAGAERVLSTDPRQAEQALTNIRAQGKQAMQELRRMLPVLRTAEGANDEQQPAPARPPGLDDLDELVTAVGRTGLSVQLDRLGAARPVPPSIGLAAYRLIQESLTNVTKHAGPGSSATVRVVWGDDLLVEVSDRGSGSAPPGPRVPSTGHGLLGLRERVALAGGRFAAGPLPDGGFQVTATLPVVQPDGAQPDGAPSGGAPSDGAEQDGARPVGAEATGRGRWSGDAAAQLSADQPVPER
jgi:signal transduction histidine kinase